MDSHRPPKRPRLEDQDFQGGNGRSQYRRRSPPRRGGNRSSYRPREQYSGSRVYDSYVPERTDRSSRQRSASPVRHSRQISHTEQGKSKRSQKERKENPSTRIHSLRKLLERGQLPATVQQEKERELAGLVFDQEKNRIQKAGAKNLKRYHFVRFVERQKANRTIKQLKRKQEVGDSSEELAKQLHEAEVDFNYTVYSPLAQKYVAIYARDDSTDGKAHPLPRNLSQTKKVDSRAMTDDQRHEIEVATMEAANVLHMADSKSTEKPPMWYVVEAKMKEGEEALVALRNEKLKPDQLQSDLVVGSTVKRNHDWLNDDGVINPEDLDSDSEEGGAHVNVDNDEDMSDGDGGFFEKR